MTRIDVPHLPNPICAACTGGFRAGTLGRVIGRVMTHPDRHVVAFIVRTR